MELVQIERPANWNAEIEQFESKTLFHESSWLDFVLASRPELGVDYFRIIDSGKTVGYFCAVKKRKAMVRMYGSPFPGTGIALGPIINSSVNSEALIKELLDVCREEGVFYIEMRQHLLDPAVMLAHGFTAIAGAAQICPLPATEAEAWQAMSSNCRQRIRRSQNSQLTGELATDPAAVTWFYAHYVKLLRSKGLTPDYTEQTPALLAQHLSPGDRLFIVSVRYRGEVIATALYPHDGRCMYYWDGAYDPEYVGFSPNELLHWTAMRLAMARGLQSFHIGGEPAPSRFSQKFGGRAVPYYVYRKELLPMLDQCRRAYHYWNSRWETASLLLQRAFGPGERAVPEPISLEKSGRDHNPALLAQSAPRVKTSS
jgi:hypothetical protein